MATSIKQVMNQRPFNKEQTQFESAWNKGDYKKARKIAGSIKDATLRQPLTSLLAMRGH